uniref:LEM domain-containing protein n=1 Tax=Mesocestoides corti TaxID=53468 RepID=A0A5K3EY09_MESCO
MAGKNSQIPPDLEFTLEEISAELAKLGIRETSPTRLSAIKADLDQMIARDLALPTKADEDLSDHLQSDTTLTRSWSSTSLNSNHTVTNRTNHNTANGRRSFNPPRQAFVAASSPYGDVSSFTSDSSFQSLPPKDSGTEVTDDDDSILASGYGGTSDESVSSSSNSEYHHLAGDRRLPLIR